MAYNLNNKFKDLKNLSVRNTLIKTIPNIDPNRMIGVSIPNLRLLAKEFVKEIECKKFINKLPHDTLEENLLHAILLSMIYKDIDEYLKALDKFLPYVDNWAVSDVINPKLFRKYPDQSYEFIKKKLNSSHSYSVRFGIVALLQHFLDDNFNSEILICVSRIKSDDYYVNMAIAWFFSFALIKQYNQTIIYLENNLLDDWVHNKTIQKAIDSYRISEERKQYLRSLKHVKEN